MKKSNASDEIMENEEVRTEFDANLEFIPLYHFDEKKEKPCRKLSIRKASVNSRRRRGSVDYLFSCFKNCGVDDHSYLEEYHNLQYHEQEEGGNFQVCFDNLFSLNRKEIVGDEVEEFGEMNNLLFLSAVNLQNSSESTANDKYDIMSLVEQEVSPGYSKKKRLFQVIDFKNFQKKADKTVKKKLRFLTYNDLSLKK